MNKEFTLKIPSNAIIWILVVRIRAVLANFRRMAATEVEEKEKREEIEETKTERAFLASF